MTSTQYSDVRQLYKYAIARDSFWAVTKSCEHLIAAGTPSDDPGYYAAAVGIICTYCRPFSNNARIGMLSSSLIPDQFKALHSDLIQLRNKGFAHTDTSGQLKGHGKMTEVRFVFTGTHLTTFSSRPVFNPVLLPNIKTLSDVLRQKVDQCFSSFLNRLVKVVVPNFGLADVGKEFELNVEDEQGPMVVPTKDPIAHKYPIIRPLSDL